MAHGHLERILQRWTSSHNNARMEGLNGLFQAARARARGYRNTAKFITMIYLIQNSPEGLTRPEPSSPVFNHELFGENSVHLKRTLVAGLTVHRSPS